MSEALSGPFAFADTHVEKYLRAGCTPRQAENPFRRCGRKLPHTRVDRFARRLGPERAAVRAAAHLPARGLARADLRHGLPPRGAARPADARRAVPDGRGRALRGEEPAAPLPARVEPRGERRALARGGHKALAP